MRVCVSVSHFRGLFVRAGMHALMWQQVPESQTPQGFSFGVLELPSEWRVGFALVPRGLPRDRRHKVDGAAVDLGRAV